MLRPTLIITSLLQLAVVTAIHGAELPEFKAATQAMREKLPEVAMKKLERLLTAPKLAPNDLLQARALYAEAAVRSGNLVRALEVAKDAEPKSQPELAFWKAVALQGQGHWAEAIEVYAQLPEDGWSLAAEARMNHVATLASLGDTAAAIDLLSKAGATTDKGRVELWKADILIRQKKFDEAAATLAAAKELTPAQQHQRSYLLGRLDFEMGRFAEAAIHFNDVAQQTGDVSQSLHQSSILAMARAQRLAGEKATAARSLVVLIAESPEPAVLAAAFREFRLCNQPSDPELEKLLAGWASGTQVAVSAEATAALIEAREAEGNKEAALELCAAFNKAHPTSASHAEMVLRQSRLLISLGRGPEALKLIEPLQAPSQPAFLRAWAKEVAAYSHLKSGDFAAATQAFQAVTEATPEPERKLIASHQAALAAIQSDQPALLEAIFEMPHVQQQPKFLADVLLERGLYAAAKGSAEAESLLTEFLKKFPDHTRAFEPAVALAELSLEQIGSSPETLTNRISSARQFAKSAEDEERLEILTLHFESLNAEPEIFAKRVDEFLAKRPESPFRADLLMKCAVKLYSSQQYAVAKARFLQLVESDPESPLVDAARFFAGKAALGSLAKDCDQEAIKLWNLVAQGKSEFRFEARLEQAKLDQRRDPNAALQIFDSILKSEPPPDANLRFTVLCLRGETLIATQSEKPEKLQEALAGFDLVISSSTASAYWKQQALVRKGACLESLKDEVAALQAYHDAMNLVSPSTNAEADYHWFFRAGEKAMRLLEAKSNWKAAVSIAQKLSEAPGPQAAIARERASRLMTEHFLWEEE